MPQVLTRVVINTSSPTHTHKDFIKGLVTLTSSTFVYPLEALGGCSSWLVENMLVTFGLCEGCLWLLDFVLRSYWFVFLVVLVFHLHS